ncbi:MAG: PspC domain-containing protein, partial [Segetibacter sp.]
MKKVININFQGRVIPIEETAYDMLKQYVESLRLFFANEEGRDEIINDIEGRIAELFAETLKKGGTCITDEDVTTIINSMGRPEDFEAEEANVKSQLSGEGNTSGQQRTYTYANTSARKLYRDENHKLLGGVCSGIANYFAIDSIIVRILFIIFFGVTFFVYLILWIAVPSSSSVVIGSQRKRLFRDPDSKIIAGVCSGLAQYFAVQVWIPRILFLIPFFSFVFRWGHWGWWD